MGVMSTKPVAWAPPASRARIVVRTGMSALAKGGTTMTKGTMTVE
jgi:hypothetical protein